MSSLRGEVAAARERGRRDALAAAPDREETFEVEYAVTIHHRGTASTPDPAEGDIERAVQQLGDEFTIVAVTATRK